MGATARKRERGPRRYLKQRGNTFTFRYRFPNDVGMPKPVVEFALNTSDKAEAEARALLEVGRYKALVAQIRIMRAAEKRFAEPAPVPDGTQTFGKNTRITTKNWIMLVDSDGNVIEKRENTPASQVGFALEGEASAAITRPLQQLRPSVSRIG